MHEEHLQRTIWFLWYQGEGAMPEVVKLCLQSWRNHHPHWKLIVLSDQNLKEYIDGSSLLDTQWSTIPDAAKSDLIRVHLLAEYGGVWVDSSTYCNRPLDTWLPERMKSGFYAFSRPNVDRMISSWFLAAEKGNSLIVEYKHAAFDFWKTINPKRLLKREERYGGLNAIAKRLYNINPQWAIQSWFVRSTRISHYFWFHYLFEALYFSSESFAKVWDDTPVFSANIPHTLMHFGYTEPVDTVMERELNQPKAPLYKLNWRIDPQDYKGSVIHTLLDS